MSGDIYESSKIPRLGLRGVFRLCRSSELTGSVRFERPAGGEFVT